MSTTNDEAHSKVAHSLWGKKDDVGEHLLEYHLLDTASVCRQFLLQDKRVTSELSSLLNFDEKNTVNLICFLCSIHDIGKVCCRFQKQNDSIMKYRHDLGGYHLLISPDIFNIILSRLVSDESHRSKDIARIFLLASAMHHGSPRGYQSSNDQYQLLLDDESHKVAYDIIINMICLYGDFQPVVVNKESCEYLMQASNLMSGIISNCDWIASAKFEYRSDTMPLGDYREISERYAFNLFRDNNLKIAPVSVGGDIDFADIFGFRPSPMQKLLSDHVPEGSELCIVEDATGAGKTEAAISLAISYLREGVCDGITFALPTRSTSNLMFRRMRTYADSVFDEPVSISLLHSTSDLELMKDSFLPLGTWTTGRNKSLFASMAVCTVDQILGAIMPVRYQTLKLLSVMRHVLIIDEVHSYDAFTFGLICNLVKYCRYYHISVILLSATIPSAMKIKLIESYGIRVERTSTAYPLVTFCRDSVEQLPCDCSVRSVRKVLLRYVSDEESILTEMIKLAKSGMRVCWIRNTVDDAISGYRHIPDGDYDRLLLHSRFVVQDRSEIEQRLFSLCGKGVMRKGLIVISTQVIEQSLDIEFERVYSDLAPIDSLIQRMGRDQRFGDSPIPCEFVVNGPPVGGLPDARWYQDYFGNAAFVYRNHFALYRTAELMQRDSISIPQDYREMIEYAYSEPPTDSPFMANYTEFKKAALNSADGSERQVLNPATGYGRNIMADECGENLWDVLESVTTRESDDRTCQCILLKEVSGHIVAITGNPETSVITLKRRFVPSENSAGVYDYGRWRYIGKLILEDKSESNGELFLISDNGVKYTKEIGAEYV